MHYDEGPSITALRELIALVDHGGVGAAAAALDLTQPTLSRKLMVFKGTVAREGILCKHGKTLELTERGRLAMPAVRRLLQQYEQVARYLAAEQTHRQVVRLGLGQFGAEHYLPQLLTALDRQILDAELQPRMLRGRDRIERVAMGKLELAIVTHDPTAIRELAARQGTDPDRIAITEITRRRIMAVAHKKSPWAKLLRQAPADRVLEIEQLAAYTLVGLDSRSGFRRRLDMQLATKRLRLQFDAGTGIGGWAAARELARAQLGVALVPANMLSTDDRDLVMRPLPETFAIVDYLINSTEIQDGPIETCRLAILKLG